MFNIKYFILVPLENETDEPEITITPFQGFNMGVTELDFALLIDWMIYFPNHPLEIFMNQKSLLDFRRHASRKNIAALNIALFSKEILDEDDVLYVIACRGEDLELLGKIGDDLHIKPIIVSNIRHEKVININGIRPRHNFLDGEIRRRIVAYFKRNNIQKKVPDIRENYKSKLNLAETGGGAVISNEIFLKSLGYSFTGHANLPSSQPEKYLNFVVELSNITLNLIKSEGAINEIIMYSTGMTPSHYDTKNNFWNDIFRQLEVKWHKDFIINGLIKNPHYSGFVIKKFTPDNPFKNPVVAAIFNFRKRELLATNLSVALLAASSFAAPIRLPNSVNFHFNKLKQLEEFSKRSDAKAHRLMQNKFIEINAALKGEIGDGIEKILLEEVYFCTICSDFPLEWLYFGKLPLMISHEVSKIPMTPGNMLTQYCAAGDSLEITSAAFEEILVIRSFKGTDRLKHMLEKAVKGFPISEKTKVRFVDVAKIADVAETLNEFQGAMVIFDCHGSHDGLDGIGWLAIGDEKLNTWELAHVARIPPIVLLSACLTSAVGGSHASVANGLLRSGALSVLGTFLPVHGIKSAIFMARIIYRLDMFLPALKKAGREIVTWRTLISTFMRMSYMTDFLKYFRDTEKILSDDDYMKLHLDSNLKINSLQPNWFDDVLKDLSTVTKKTEHELIEMVQANNPLMETMLYCQHGRPELITIHF